MSIDRLLMDFSDSEAALLAPLALDPGFDALFDNHGREMSTGSIAVEVDVAAETEAAYQRGLSEGRDVASAEFEAHLASERQQFQDELAQARAQWAAETSDAFVQQISEGLEALRHQLADAVGDVLMPLIATVARDRAIEQLIEELSELSRDQQGLRVEVSGPEDVIEALRERLPVLGLDVAWLSDNQCEVNITAGATVVETRLNQWIDQVREQAA
jgi:hypothetical protein